jgi:hypothetical protein
MRNTGLLKRPTYSALVGTVSAGPRGRGAVYKKALASKLRSGTVGRAGPTDDFKVCRSLQDVVNNDSSIDSL